MALSKFVTRQLISILANKLTILQYALTTLTQNLPQHINRLIVYLPDKVTQ